MNLHDFYILQYVIFHTKYLEDRDAVYWRLVHAITYFSKLSVCLCDTEFEREVMIL